MPRVELRQLLAWLLLCCASQVWAQSTPSTAPTAAPAAPAPSALDLQVQRISAELRCLVCQNQTIADSHAELAQDLRRQVRELLVQGRSEAEVLDYMTTRYGDFVLYRPPVKGTTWLLWFGPAVLLAGAALTLLLVLRRRARLPAEAFEPDESGEPDDVKDRPTATR